MKRSSRAEVRVSSPGKRLTCRRLSDWRPRLGCKDRTCRGACCRYSCHTRDQFDLSSLPQPSSRKGRKETGSWRLFADQRKRMRTSDNAVRTSLDWSQGSRFDFGTYDLTKLPEVSLNQSRSVGSSCGISFTGNSGNCPLPAANSCDLSFADTSPITGLSELCCETDDGPS